MVRSRNFFGQTTEDARPSSGQSATDSRAALVLVVSNGTMSVSYLEFVEGREALHRRFISPDPLGTLGLWSRNAQLLNLFAYANDVPVVLTDPDGEFVVSSSIALGYGGYLVAAAAAGAVYAYLQTPSGREAVENLSRGIAGAAAAIAQTMSGPPQHEPVPGSQEVFIRQTRNYWNNVTGTFRLPPGSGWAAGAVGAAIAAKEIYDYWDNLPLPSGAQSTSSHVIEPITFEVLESSPHK